MENKYYIATPNYKIEVPGDPINIPGIIRDLFIRKTENEYVVTDIETGCKLAIGKTKEESIENVLLLKDKINNYNKHSDVLEKLPTYDEFIKLINKFEKIFDVNFYQFIWQSAYHITGLITLDLTALENLFKYEPDYINISLKDYINKKYGSEAVQVVKQLSHINNL